MEFPEGGAAAFVPPQVTITTLQEASRACRGCPLYKNATQTVFGEGGPRVRVMFVGEQPGNQEDLQGRPFVGPAGGVLDSALETAGIPRSEIYVTNAVKHFKFELRGKRRLHKKPNSLEIGACKPWLEAEVAVLRPKIIVCLGATAVQAVMGRPYPVTRIRGKVFPSQLAPQVTATVHPSSLLRAPDEQSRRLGMDRFVADLRAVRVLMDKLEEAE